MRHNKAAFILLPIIVLVLAGCGGSSSGNSAADPFARTVTAPGSVTVTTPVTVQDPTFSLTLSTDLIKPTDLTILPQIDVNIGTVELTASLTNVSGGVYLDPVTKQPVAPGAPVPNQAVTFNVLAGPGAISYTTPVTDKNGAAKAIFTTGDVPYTTNVIIEAASTVDGKNYRAYTTFQIVRGTGVIMFTSAAGLKPGSQTNMFPQVTLEVDPTLGIDWSYRQLIPFKVTDSNGNPRVGVSVTISATSSKQNNVTFVQTTCITDSAGQGIFSSDIEVGNPVAGGTNTVDVIFKAVTNDPIPVTAYIGGSYSFTGKAAPSPSP